MHFLENGVLSGESLGDIHYKQCNYIVNFHRAIKQYVKQNLIIKYMYSSRQELAFIKRYVKSLWAMGVDKRF